MTANIQTVTLGGERFVILPEADYRQLVGETWEPPLPAPDAQGNFPAVEAARVLARKIIRRRRAWGLPKPISPSAPACGWRPSAAWNTPSTAPMSRPSIKSSAHWSRRNRPVGPHAAHLGHRPQRTKAGQGEMRPRRLERMDDESLGPLNLHEIERIRNQ